MQSSSSSDGLWVFGYGSLLWKPGFEATQSVPAVLAGYRRGFFLWSIHYRGTPERPGLVLGLDEGEASTKGLALFTPDRAGVLAYLRERELVSYAYREVFVPLTLETGETVEAVTYVMDHAHAQYCPPLPLDEQAEIIARAEGSTGRNADYLFETNARLAALGQGDAELDALEVLVRARL